jgi:hypothetical protein
MKAKKKQNKVNMEMLKVYISTYLIYEQHANCLFNRRADKWKRNNLKQLRFYVENLKIYKESIKKILKIYSKKFIEPSQLLIILSSKRDKKKVFNWKCVKV